MIHLHPTPTFPLSPVTAVVPDRGGGLVPVIYQSGVPVPTWRDPCIQGVSMEVSAVVTNAGPLTVEYRDGPWPLPPAPADEILGGIEFEVHSNGEVGYCHVDDDGGVSHPGRLLGAALRIFGRTYAGLPLVELALSWINGDTENPQGARLVNRFEIVPPEGWVAIHMTPSMRHTHVSGTLEQGRRRDVRVCLVPSALADVTAQWINAGAGRLLALNDAGEIVTPHPSGARWTRPGDKAREASLTRMVKLSAYARDGAKLPELLAYGESTAIPNGWRDAIGQPYGGKTGGQQFAPLMWDVATNAGIAFKYLETLRTGVADRCLYLTTGGEPVTFDAGLSFAVDMNAGARLFATRGTNSTRAKFFDAPDDPGTERNPFGSIDWQHGSARFGPSEIMATLWNDPLAKYGLALDAAMARIETTEAEVRAKGPALGRAEAWMAHVNALDVMFNGTAAAMSWLNECGEGIGDGSRIAEFAGSHKEVKYARAYTAWRDWPNEVAALAGTNNVKTLFAQHVDKMIQVADAHGVPNRTVTQPWQRYALAHGLRMMHRAGVDIDFAAYRRILSDALFEWADAGGVPYRVFVDDGSRASDESDGMHKLWALGLLAEVTRDIGLAAFGVHSIQSLLGLHVSQWRAEMAGEPNAELLLGVLP